MIGEKLIRVAATPVSMFSKEIKPNQTPSTGRM